MNALIVHRYHMVDAWITDNRDKLVKFNRATRTAELKDGTTLRILVVNSYADTDKLRSYEFDKLLMWYEVQFHYQQEVRRLARFKTWEMVHTL